MQHNLKKYLRKGERGNVLFLILIAVALFAALSYAVTSSSRSGGGDANEESSLVQSASITQYPASVRTAIIRMMVSKGVDPEDLIFAGPADFATECDEDEEIPNCVFHPNGGGATLASAPADIMAGGAAGQWYFSANYEILNVGTSVEDDPAGNDIIAFLPGITNSLCKKINEELGITGVTEDDSGWDLTDTDVHMTSADYDIPDEDDIIGDAASGLAGQAFGCMTDSGGKNIYYHVLIER